MLDSRCGRHRFVLGALALVLFASVAGGGLSAEERRLLPLKIKAEVPVPEALAPELRIAIVFGEEFTSGNPSWRRYKTDSSDYAFHDRLLEIDLVGALREPVSSVLSDLFPSAVVAESQHAAGQADVVVLVGLEAEARAFDYQYDIGTAEEPWIRKASGVKDISATLEFKILGWDGDLIGELRALVEKVRMEQTYAMRWWSWEKTSKRYGQAAAESLVAQLPRVFRESVEIRAAIAANELRRSRPSEWAVSVAFQEIEGWRDGVLEAHESATLKVVATHCCPTNHQPT